MKTILKAIKTRGAVIFAALLLLALVIGSALLQPTASQADVLNGPYAGTNSAVTIDAARLRGYQGGTNPVVGISTSYVFRVTAIGLTNTFTIINGIITAVSQP
jgi:hypothetical protein